MVNVSLARRYARALLDVTSEGGQPDAALAQLDSLASALEQSRELESIYSDPAYGRAQRAAIAEKLFPALNITATPVQNLMRLLVERSRVSALPDIARVYRTLVDEKAGRVRGRVISAHPLDANTLAQLGKTLETLTQRKVVVDAQVDPSLLGGVSAQVGSLVYDGSLRTQLNALQRELTSG
jgi:F-type H+-transporting ATPase subunit delta